MAIKGQTMSCPMQVCKNRRCKEPSGLHWHLYGTATLVAFALLAGKRLGNLATALEVPGSSQRTNSSWSEVEETLLMHPVRGRSCSHCCACSPKHSLHFYCSPSFK